MNNIVSPTANWNTGHRAAAHLFLQRAVISRPGNFAAKGYASGRRVLGLGFHSIEITKATSPFRMSQ